MIQSRENLVTQEKTDRQTYESNFLGRCPTDVECPCISVSFHMENNKNKITKTKALFKSCYQKLFFLMKAVNRKPVPSIS